MEKGNGKNKNGNLMWSKQKLAIGSIKKQTSNKSKKPKHAFVLKTWYTYTLKVPFDLEFYFSLETWVVPIVFMSMKPFTECLILECV